MKGWIYLIKYYDITESTLDSKPFEAEAIYYCTDTGNVYVDSLAEMTRKKMSSDVIMIGTETDRAMILAPIPFKIYCVLSSGSMYIYYNAKWNRLGVSQFEICNVLVENGSLNVSDPRIIAADDAEFIPDLSVIDLVSNISATCADGSVTVTLTSNYPIPGTIKIN